MDALTIFFNSLLRILNVKIDLFGFSFSFFSLLIFSMLANMLIGWWHKLHNDD